MKANDVKLLKCIFCEGNLKISSFETLNNEVIDGKIFCIQCQSEWPIIKGVPRILKFNLLGKIVFPRYKKFFLKYSNKFNFKNVFPQKKEKKKIKTALSFGFEWTKYSKVIKEFERDWIRYFSPFFSPEDMKNKVVVDIGCGLAKHGYFTAKYGAKYIGLDLSEAIDVAYANVKEFDVLLVQADIYDIPFKESEIDIYYSIGVLHHLPDSKKGFLKIVESMKDKSKVFIWVYGKYKNMRALYIYNPIRIITTKIPQRLLYLLCHIPASITHLFNLFSIAFETIGLRQLAKKIPFYYYSKFPYSFKHNDSFDVFATPTQIYYTKKEIAGWFRSSEITDFNLLYDKVQGIKGFGIK